jgi:hypothetical protein
VQQTCSTGPAKARQPSGWQGQKDKRHTLAEFAFPPAQVEVPKPSEGLEYTYARKPSNFDHERKDLAHIWEVGGSQEFAEQIAQSDQLFLTVKQVRDLSHSDVHFGQSSRCVQPQSSTSAV